MGLAATQLRKIPLISSWIVIGTSLFHQIDIGKLMATLFFLIFLKSGQGLYVYFVVYGRNMGTLEYLIDHL